MGADSAEPHSIHSLCLQSFFHTDTGLRKIQPPEGYTKTMALRSYLIQVRRLEALPGSVLLTISNDQNIIPAKSQHGWLASEGPCWTSM